MISPQVPESIAGSGGHIHCCYMVLLPNTRPSEFSFEWLLWRACTNKHSRDSWDSYETFLSGSFSTAPIRSRVSLCSGGTGPRTSRVDKCSTLSNIQAFLHMTGAQGLVVWINQFTGYEEAGTGSTVFKRLRDKKKPF